MCCFLIISGQPKRHLLTTGWSVFVSAKRLVAGDSVLFIWYTFRSTFLNTFYSSMMLQTACLLYLSVFSLIGMKRTSCFWEYVVPVGHKLSCHHQFFQVIACTLDFLQLQHMPQQLIAALPCSLIQGCVCFPNLYF